MWSTAGAMALGTALWAWRQVRRRHKSRLPCSHWGCRMPTEWVFVEPDYVRGLCDRHMEEEKESREEDDQYGEREADHGD